MTKGTVLHYRCEQIYGVLCKMEKKNDLPLPNRYRLSKVIIETWKKDGFQQAMLDMGYTWNPSMKWLTKRMGNIKQVAFEHKRIFEFYRPEDDSFKGFWMFLNKKQFMQLEARNTADLNTRILTENKRRENGTMMGYLMPPPIPEILMLDAKQNQKRLTK